MHTRTRAVPFTTHIRTRACTQACTESQTTTIDVRSVNGEGHSHEGWGRTIIDSTSRIFSTTPSTLEEHLRTESIACEMWQENSASKKASSKSWMRRTRDQQTLPLSIPKWKLHTSISIGGWPLQLVLCRWRLSDKRHEQRTVRPYQ